MPLQRYLPLCALILLSLTLSTTTAQAQANQRVFGAGGLMLDNRTTPIRTITLTAPLSLTTTYTLQLPTVPPPGPTSTLTSDGEGNMFWSSGIASLPSLPAGNIWVGNNSNVATPYAPTVAGAIMTLDGSNRPAWSTALPPATTISASQITTGTIQPGVTINVGNGGTIISTGGNITANNLTGAGSNKYAGVVAIPMNALGLNIPFTNLASGAAIQFNINDPNIPGIIGFMDNMTVGGGFHITFSAAYPTTTGTLTYIVVNP